MTPNRLRSQRRMMTKAAFGVSAAAAVCLSAAGCGTSAHSTGASSTGTSAHATGTADPLAGLTAQQIVAKAFSGLKSAASFTMDGTVSTDGQMETLSFGITRKGCSETLDMGPKGTVTMILIGQNVWMKGDAAFWKSPASGDAGMASTYAGKYVKLPAEGGSTASPATPICSASEMMSSSSPVPLSTDVTKGALTTVNGQQVYPLTDKAKDTTMYVSDTSTPQFVEIADTEKGKTARFTVAYGAPKPITAPPASETISFSGSGLGS